MTTSGHPRTAVIGAGISGLTAGKMLKDYGIPYTTFETSDRIGGNWAFGNPNGHSSAYRSLHIDTSKHRLSFKDFPIPDDFPSFPHHSEIKAYLDAYADTFGLLDEHRVRQRRRAGTARRKRLGDRGPGRCHPAVRPVGRRQRTPLGRAAAGLSRHIHRRDHPLAPLHRPADTAATDRQADPGRRHRQQRRGHHRRIVVEVAAEQGHAVHPVRARGSCRNTSPARPGDKFFKTTPYLPLSWQRKAAQMFAPWSESTRRNTGCRRPITSSFEAHPTQSVELPLRLGSGDVTPKPNVARLDGDTVHFDDGTSDEFDVIVYATGYNITFPFFDADFISAPDNQHPALQADVQAGHRRSGVHRLRPGGADAVPVRGVPGAVAGRLCGGPLRPAVDRRDGARHRRRPAAATPATAPTVPGTPSRSTTSTTNTTCAPRRLPRAPSGRRPGRPPVRVAAG